MQVGNLVPRASDARFSGLIIEYDAQHKPDELQVDFDFNEPGVALNGVNERGDVFHLESSIFNLPTSSLFHGDRAEIGRWGKAFDAVKRAARLSDGQGQDPTLFDSFEPLSHDPPEQPAVFADITQILDGAFAPLAGMSNTLGLFINRVNQFFTPEQLAREQVTLRHSGMKDVTIQPGHSDGFHRAVKERTLANSTVLLSRKSLSPLGVGDLSVLASTTKGDRSIFSRLPHWVGGGI